MKIVALCALIATSALAQEVEYAEGMKSFQTDRIIGTYSEEFFEDIDLVTEPRMVSFSTNSEVGNIAGYEGFDAFSG